jgi:hypothetical protein
MARKAGQLISRGPRTWLVRVSLGRDPETGTRKYHNKTIRGSFRAASPSKIIAQSRMPMMPVCMASSTCGTSVSLGVRWSPTSAKSRPRPSPATGALPKELSDRESMDYLTFSGLGVHLLTATVASSRVSGTSTARMP